MSAVLIPVYRGRADRNPHVVAYALVDAADAEWVSAHYWTLNAEGYVGRRTARPESKRLLLHREILGLRSDDRGVTDHKNRNKIDCRRCNLRVVTRAQNNQNRDSYANGKSRFRGVCWDPRGYWRASGQANGHWSHIGNFGSELQAARAASEWRREHLPFSTEVVAA